MKKHYLNYHSIDTSGMSVFFKIFLPVLVETLLGTLYHAIDMAMVGRYDSNGLSAIGLTSNPLSIFLSIFSAVNVGTTTLVAWNIGAKKNKEAQDVVKISLILNLALGLIMTVFGMLMAVPIVKFMGADEVIYKLSIDYYNILVVGTTFQALTFSITASMRGAGYSSVPMIYNSGANLLNVIGNYILIYGKLGFEPMGVIGAGYSTLISRIICCIVALIYVFCSKKAVISFKHNYGKFKFVPRNVVQILRIGIPTAVETLILNCGGMFYVKIVNLLGITSFSAHQICNSVSGVLSAPSAALKVTSSTIIGQHLGAHDFEKANSQKKTMCLISFLISIVSSTIIFLFSRNIVGLFAQDSDVEVVRLASSVLYIIAISYFFGNYSGVVMGAIRAAGDTRFALVLTMTTFFCLKIPLAYLFGIFLGFGLIGVWFSTIPVSIINIIIILHRYKSGKWLEVFKKESV